jgi:transcription elongation factor SPT6
VKANPSKSIYGFTLNRKRPGHFNLCFLANSIAAIQTWVGVSIDLISGIQADLPGTQPVRVTPEAYFLYDTPVTGVSELCDAFKIRYAGSIHVWLMG